MTELERLELVCRRVMSAINRSPTPADSRLLLYLLIEELTKVNNERGKDIVGDYLRELAKKDQKE